MNVFKLLGIISVNNDEANKKIDETSGKASAFASSMGSAFSTAGRVIGRGLIAGSAAVGALITGSVKQYAQYEQLVDGVETLFKDSSTTIQQYANNAFVTAGMSANDYMATVTSFSASLIKSLGGDTAKAAEMGNMAVTDMADNANKMGTSLSSIQDAYQGFAKQNYTMLDNLKLGYGGTQKEMQRLLKDAQKITGKKYNLKNLSDVYEAINVIQTEMGITGTTSKEASETIAGSLATMGAAWQNLIVGIADDSQDLDGLISKFADSAVTTFENISKRIPSIVKGLNQLVMGIVPMLPGIIQDLLPTVLEGVVGLFSGLATALPEIAQVVFDVVSNLISQIDFMALGENLGLAFVSLINRIPELLSNLGNAISYGWSNIVWPIIRGLFKAVFNVELPDWETVKNDIATGWSEKVWPHIQGFFKQTFGIELADWEKTSADISAWWTSVVNGVGDVFKAIFSIFTEDEDGLTVAERLKLWWGKVTKAIGNAIGAIFMINTEDKDGSSVAARLMAWWDMVTSALGDYISAIFSIFTEDDDGRTVGERLKAWWDKVTTALGNYISAVFSIFTEDADGKTVGQRLKDWWALVLNFLGNAISAVFGIETPSIDSIVQKIKNWWADVKKKLSLSISFVVNAITGKRPDAGEGVDTVTSPTISDLTDGQYGNVKENAAGAIFSAPTIFDTRLGRQMVGEAGPEAVAPISVLRGYVREEVEAAMGNSRDNGMKEAFQDFANNLPDMLVNAFSTMKFDVNNREFARLVKAVN